MVQPSVNSGNSRREEQGGNLGQNRIQEHSQESGQGQGQQQDQQQDSNYFSQWFRRVRNLSNPLDYWKALYKEVFEYDMPLIHAAPRVFRFAKSQQKLEGNPWKESFQQLQRGLHVRPGFSGNEFGHNIRNFDTVHDALNYAKCSDNNCEVLGHDAVIFVHAGTHQGGILIDFNVAIIGASAGAVNESVIIYSENESTVKFVKGADGAYLGFITLRFAPTIEKSKSFCLEIVSIREYLPCNPIVHECIIENFSITSSAVRVSGEGANPVIKYSVIRGIMSVGIIVESFAQGTYHHCKITTTHLEQTASQTGIWVKTLGGPIVYKNYINGHKFGIKVSDEGYGIFNENRVVYNETAAIEVSKKANPLVLHNILEHGRKATVVICDRGFGVFLDNQINARLTVGIDSSECSNPTIKLNRIHNSKIGVNITCNSRGWFQENKIFRSSSAGICIRSSNPFIIENKIHNNRIGIQVTQEGRGHIVHNKIYFNSLNGIRIDTGSTPVLQNNLIFAGHIGVHFQDKSCGELEDNVICSNRHYNVKIESGSNPIIRKNRIRNGKHGGVSITNRGLGFLEENDIYENFAGVCITDLSDPILKCNKIFRNTGCGVSILNNGKGKLEKNKLFNNTQSDIVISSQSNPILLDNEIGAGEDKTSNPSPTLENGSIT